LLRKRKIKDEGVSAMRTNAAIIPIVPVIRLKKILYATNFSVAEWGALNLVAMLARRYQSTVCVAHICEPKTYPLVAPEVGYAIESSHGSKVYRHMSDLLRSSPLNSLPVKAIVRSGQTVEQLASIVHEEHIDLAVVCTRSQAGFKRVMAGSVAEAAFRNLVCPVLTVGRHLLHRFATAGIKNILFPTDLSRESMAVFPYLASLAHEYQAKITVLHVVPPDTARDPDAPALAGPIRRELERALSPHISPECETEFIVAPGRIAECIVEQASARHADLIGLGVRQASGISTRFEKTVAYQVVANAQCPVLTCRL
jgi:nucleotide-binding universal stress UspA family protein